LRMFAKRCLIFLDTAWMRAATDRVWAAVRWLVLEAAAVTHQLRVVKVKPRRLIHLAETSPNSPSKASLILLSAENMR